MYVGISSTLVTCMSFMGFMVSLIWGLDFIAKLSMTVAVLSVILFVMMAYIYHSGLLDD